VVEFYVFVIWVALKIKDKQSQEKEKAEQAVKDKKELKGDLNSILNLTKIGYGGTKPQNISVLNNQNGGIAYLLSSMPPI
jgi:CRISPR-associated protein Csy1